MAYGSARGRGGSHDHWHADTRARRRLAGSAQGWPCFASTASASAVIASVAAPERNRSAAAQLARSIRREALDDRNLVALARDEEPALVAALVALCVRRR
jgi:hypothetical protein